jgi:hypothetical protein
MDKSLTEQVKILRNEIEALNQEVYRNNFSGHQDFNKTCNFTTKLKIPHYDSIPLVGEVGEILESGGKLYICSSSNTFTLV